MSVQEEDPTASELGADGALSRWALGSVVLVALAASEITGAGTVAALPLAFITVTISGRQFTILQFIYFRYFTVTFTEYFNTMWLNQGGLNIHKYKQFFCLIYGLQMF